MEWTNYLYNITEEGYYSFSANLNTGKLLEKINWLMDGDQSAVTDLVNFNDETWDVGPVLFYLKSGSHALKINTSIEGCIINSVSLNKSQAVDTEQSAASPFHFSLEQNYPNPFNLSTNIVFSIPIKGNVVLEIFDMLGKVLKILADGEFTAGIYNFHWDGKDSEGQEVSSGAYFYRLCFSAKVRLTKKMFLMR